MSGARGAGTIAVVLKGYPRLSETFIAQELLALEQRGLSLALYSLRRPTDAATHPLHARSGRRSPTCRSTCTTTCAASGAHGATCGGDRGYRAARAAWWRDLRRDPTRNRVRRFGQALVLAAELPRDIAHLHAHFLHTPASVTRYAALLRGLPLELLGAREGHLDDARVGKAREARDVRVDGDVHGGQRAIICATSPATRPRVDLVYHGIDTTRFPRPGRHAGSPRRQRIRRARSRC